MEYGTGSPGVSRVMEIANFEGSGLMESCCTFALGTGMYVLTRDTLDCFCTEYSGSGAPSACTLTAIPLKQGIPRQLCAVAAEAAQLQSNSGVSRSRMRCLLDAKLSKARFWCGGEKVLRLQFPRPR